MKQSRFFHLKVGMWARVHLKLEHFFMWNPKTHNIWPSHSTCPHLMIEPTNFKKKILENLICL